MNVIGTKMMNTAKRSKLSVIPVTEDLVTLRAYILKEMSETSLKLDKTETNLIGLGWLS